MGELEIREVDVQDEPALRSWWETGRAASAERPFDAWPTWEVSRATLPDVRADSALSLYLAVEDGRVVGAGRYFVFLLDNTHLAEIDVHVAPEHRRRGVGTRVLDALETRARGEGRTTVIGSAYAPVGGDSPGSLFAAASGYPVGSEEETKLVDLASAAPTWRPLEEEVAAALDGYRLEVFESRVPDEYAEDYCALLSTFIGLVPTGDLVLEDAAWTVERLRANEERSQRVGRLSVMAVAVAPDGHLCGFSDLAVSTHDPRHGGVGGTLVLPEHRGHRLGLGMKLRTHRRVLELFPDCAHVETGNAGVNVPMNSVNERMGYRVVERCLDVQKVL
ncbi:MAG: hypothetical protein JWO76_649 [Nocardioides sp.]|nr:hypothetical protein [Nocardioides sp.]